MAVQATAVWRVRPSGVNTNGGGYDSTTYPGGTDYSQQNAAQASGTNGSTSGAGSTTFTDATAAAFTAAMVGNCIQIASGTNFQAGFYFVVSRTNANSVVLDRTPSSGGAGSVGVWKLGGGWADWWTNTSPGPLVAGNVVYVLGSGIPNPSSYVYDYTFSTTVTLYDPGNPGRPVFANDPLTPSYKAPPDTNGGMPTTKITTHAGGSIIAGNQAFQGMWFIGGTGLVAGDWWFDSVTSTRSPAFLGCVFDQFGFDIYILGEGGIVMEACEAFSSVAGTPGGNQAFFTNSYTSIIGCNIHDVVSGGIYASNNAVVANTIVAKCGGFGIFIEGLNTFRLILNCTIDGNGSDGLKITGTGIASAFVCNNIFSNQTVAATSGLNVTGGTTFGNTQAAGFIDYNVYYNNTSDVTGISHGPHDTSGGSNPYVGQTTENYQLA